jgi:hypothetical protein
MLFLSSIDGVNSTSSDVAPADPHAFNPLNDNVGMVVIAVIILVTWLAFRRMLELSERSDKKDKPKR